MLQGTDWSQVEWEDELINSDCEEENFSRGADGGILLPMKSRVYGSEHKTHSQGNFKLWATVHISASPLCIISCFLNEQNTSRNWSCETIKMCYKYSRNYFYDDKQFQSFLWPPSPAVYKSNLIWDCPQSGEKGSQSNVAPTKEDKFLRVLSKEKLWGENLINWSAFCIKFILQSSARDAQYI